MAAGRPTGRDGIEGASFASGELTEEAAQLKASIPRGYPDMGKRLMEARLEAIKAGLLVGIQDMGAAGLTSSASEMAAEGQPRDRTDLRLVPVQDSDMTPYEITLSGNPGTDAVCGSRERGSGSGGVREMECPIGRHRQSNR